MTDIRWYKGKYKVEIILKSKGNYRVRALEVVWQRSFSSQDMLLCQIGQEFTTVPRLLWRHPRK